MKNQTKENQFILTSPQEELREMSFEENIQKITFQSPRLSKRSTQKFAIDSWDISQKLKPFKSTQDRYKDTYSSHLSSLHQKSWIRSKSVFIVKDVQNTNNHNFNSRKKSILSIYDEKKPLQFLNKSHKTIEKTKMFVSLQKQDNKNKAILKQRNKSQSQRLQQKEMRTKTIQSYLTHQKELINRQKDFIHSQRICKEGIQFCKYPTQYWQTLNNNFSDKKSRKRKSNSSHAKALSFEQPKQLIIKLNPQLKIRSNKRFKQQSNAIKSKSPIKRFQIYMDKLHKVTFD